MHSLNLATTPFFIFKKDKKSISEFCRLGVSRSLPGLGFVNRNILLHLNTYNKCSSLASVPVPILFFNIYLIAGLNTGSFLCFLLLIRIGDSSMGLKKFSDNRSDACHNILYLRTYLRCVLSVSVPAPAPALFFYIYLIDGFSNGNFYVFLFLFRFRESTNGPVSVSVPVPTLFSNIYHIAGFNTGNFLCFLLQFRTRDSTTVPQGTTRWPGGVGAGAGTGTETNLYLYPLPNCMC
jgi:hypothetical protein